MVLVFLIESIRTYDWNLSYVLADSMQEDPRPVSRPLEARPAVITEEADDDLPAVPLPRDRLRRLRLWVSGPRVVYGRRPTGRRPRALPRLRCAEGHEDHARHRHAPPG